jgi:hypothetical protein
MASYNEIARDIVVAWLANGVKPAFNVDPKGQQAAEYLGNLYKVVSMMVFKAQLEAPEK